GTNEKQKAKRKKQKYSARAFLLSAFCFLIWFSMGYTEIIRMALGALRANKLRSILSMLGVAIGVFSVIGVMTALSVIQVSIENGLSFLGSNIFQFAKYPVINA